MIKHYKHCLAIIITSNNPIININIIITITIIIVMHNVADVGWLVGHVDVGGSSGHLVQWLAWTNATSCLDEVGKPQEEKLKL